MVICQFTQFTSTLLFLTWDMLATTAVLNSELGKDNCDFVLLMCNENVEIEQLHNCMNRAFQC